MSDGCLMLLQSARTLVARATVALPSGETQDRAKLAQAALADAIDQRTADLAKTEAAA